jgi:hypothetical protein
VPIEIHTLRTDMADVWVSLDTESDQDYAYGGCRTVRWDVPDEDAIALVCALMTTESGYKNTLINKSFAAGCVDDLAEELPPGVIGSRVGGGRCVIRPVDDRVGGVFANPGHPEFRDTVVRVFQPLGALLNRLDGRVKLTPDFGKYAGMADLLYEFTPHVLGVSRDLGGCGGKSTYSATGVLAAYETLVSNGFGDSPELALIGSAGAMGTTVLDHFAGRGDLDLAVCDLKYDSGARTAPEGLRRLPSAEGRLPDSAFEHGRVVIATTWGRELENSNHDLLRPGTALLLAHNRSVPSGVAGIDLMRRVSRPDTVVLPGQVLTLGGALTSRLEWFSRVAGIAQFDKPMAHVVVRRVVEYWVRQVISAPNNPYEAMLDACASAA